MENVTRPTTEDETTRRTSRGTRPARLAGVLALTGLLFSMPLAVAGQEDPDGADGGEEAASEERRPALSIRGIGSHGPGAVLVPGYPESGAAAGLWSGPEIGLVPEPPRGTALFAPSLSRGLEPRPELPPPGSIYGTPFDVGSGVLQLGDDGASRSDGEIALEGAPIRFLTGIVPLGKNPEE